MITARISRNPLPLPPEGEGDIIKCPQNNFTTERNDTNAP